MPGASQIFVGFRALGYYSNHIPLQVRYHQKHQEHYVITCVGKAFHTYNCSKLGIVSVSDSHPDSITCMAVDAYLVFTGCRNVIRAFERGRQVKHTYEGHQKDVHLLLPFSDHLISVDMDSVVKIWDIQSQELYLEMTFDNRTFEISALMHPSTYLNKILLGSRQGSMQLWNIRTNKLLHTFDGWGSPITVMEQAPAVDVVAVGTESGQIIVHNIKFDETVLKLYQDWGPITAIGFRTDGPPVMATGSTVGHIALWDLEERRLLAQMREAHGTAVTGMKFLPSEPMMITSAADNSIKEWVLDQSDGSGRLLRMRCGHRAPPNRIRFHGNSGQNILSAGQDSTLQSFSTVHDRHNKNLGQASMKRQQAKKKGIKNDEHKLPSITDFASETTRQSDWDSIVCCHRGHKVASTWNYQKCTMGKHKLENDRWKTQSDMGVEAQAVTITSCGNFCVVAQSSGHVDVYNIQSGIYRGSYGNLKAHNASVRGVAVDGLNQVTVTGAADCLLKFWKFKSKQLLHTLELDSPVSQMVLHRESNMLAVACDDFMVVVVDMETRRVVRRFSGHRNRITDMTFSPDARWLVTSSMDCTVRTWDLPTGSLLDCFLLDAACTSLTMSPTGDFLATAHVDDVGIYLWSNTTLYSHVSLRPLPSTYQPLTIVMPGTRALSDDEDEEDIAEPESANEVPAFKSPDQLSAELITLSLLPDSRWKSLTNLELIKKRNKPKEPPKVPKAAPFFLPTIPGLEIKFAPEEETPKEEPSSKIINLSSLQPQSEFQRLLQGCMDKPDYDTVRNKLRDLGPSAVDMEIRSLAPEGGGSVALMEEFLKFLHDVFTTRQDFELAQAWTGLFLKVHGSVITSETQLQQRAQQLLSTQESTWQHLQQKFNQSICLINYLKSATL
ncbi:WDR36 [Branchiostoma lanceolatum]|uniref:WDR36 protein n=1 Tax=Branchiostoma lanceolatum TaxID=7740 RepID=A0A8K0A1N2_BRALA|nr:WDR36 [Branchiostoma lanceolatum]